MLAIDYNSDKSLRWVEGRRRSSKVVGLGGVLSGASEGPDIQIYIDTLQPFIG